MLKRIAQMSHHPPKKALRLQRQYLARLEAGTMKAFQEGVNCTAEAIREVKEEIAGLEKIVKEGLKASRKTRG
jgi:hypothetical protein